MKGRGEDFPLKRRDQTDHFVYNAHSIYVDQGPHYILYCREILHGPTTHICIIMT